jgi:hypothetical protein
VRAPRNGEPPVGADGWETRRLYGAWRGDKTAAVPYCRWEPPGGRMEEGGGMPLNSGREKRSRATFERSEPVLRHMLQA